MINAKTKMVARQSSKSSKAAGMFRKSSNCFIIHGTAKLN